jgi:transposase
LSGDVELDEVYVIARHKGHPEIVAKLGRKGRRRRLKGKRGRGTSADEKPPIFGMLQRVGEVVIAMLLNVQRVTIAPLIQQTIQVGSRVYTAEYDIYNHLGEAGYTHKTMNHSTGEYARDECRGEAVLVTP